MRYFLCAVLISLGSLIANAAINPTDSLSRLLKNSSNPHQKATIYRNLADMYYEHPEEISYLKNTYEEAQKCRNKGMIIEALSDLAITYIKQDQADSARYYMHLIEKSAKHEEIEGEITFLEVRLFEYLISSKENEKLLEEALKPSKEKLQKTFHRLKQAYITASALYCTDNAPKAIPYYEAALKHCASLPEKDRAKFEFLILRPMATSYAISGNEVRQISLMEELIKKQEAYYAKYYKGKRPFYNINSRLIQSYTSLMFGLPKMSEEKARLYMNRLLEYGKGTTILADKYNVFLALNNYHIFHKNYEEAIAANDSLIKYAKTIAQYNLPGLYEVESYLYRKLDKYKDAYEYLKLSYASKDSLMTEKTNEQLSELQVKYDVDKLNHEKALLEIKNIRITVICLSSILFIALIVCIYLYYVLKKEKRMKEELKRLNDKADESEKMKTAFLNSICHEIRTPLNAIVGFSELAVDDSMDAEIKKTFPAEIQKNTEMLTSLINDMLEVSNLDSSKEDLPCLPENLNDLCTHEMDKLKSNRKEGIEYLLDLPDDHPVVSTHCKYLALALEHLLDNANKFTEKGHIRLSYRIDNSRKMLSLKIEDTGCGIPVEKQEQVFERFSKLDTYVQGNGLGLYLCRLIVKRLSGKIYIDPEYTGGTRVVVELPA